jgi:hypothetical protein
MLVKAPSLDFGRRFFIDKKIPCLCRGLWLSVCLNLFNHEFSCRSLTIFNQADKV